jgi:hypothetical protein
MNDTITTIVNVETNEYFFSTDHCQDMEDENWVPVSWGMPGHIVPREGFEDGLIKNYDDYRRYKKACGYTEIKNPNPKYQPIEF